MELALFMPVAVFGAVALGIVSVHSLVVRDRRLIRERIERYNAKAAGAKAVAPKGANTLLKQRQFSCIGSFDRLLKTTDFAERAALDLARAGVPWRVAEYMLIRWLCGAFLAMLFLMMGQVWVLAAAAGVAGFFVPKLYVGYLRKRRIKRVIGQLEDAINLIANSLKSGYSFGQGIEMVTKEMPPPIAEEFYQVLVEMNMGGSTEEALNNLIKRVPSYDLDLMATALVIQRQVGGNLAEVLENIAHTIRERIRILGEVRVRTSQARMSGMIIGLMPFFLMAAITVMSPSYMKDMFASTLGMLMLGVAMAMEGAGFLVLRRLVAIEV